MQRLLVPAAVALGLVIPACHAQQIVFSPQVLVGKKSKALQLWAVSGTAARPPVASVIYALAAKHGVAYVDPAVANERLNARDQRSLAARMFRWGSYFETGATELVNLKVVATSNQVGIGLNVAMGIVNALLPSVQKNIPVPDPAIAARIISTSLLMDAQGSVSGLFWAEPGENQGFVEILQEP